MLTAPVPGVGDQNERQNRPRDDSPSVLARDIEKSPCAAQTSATQGLLDTLTSETTRLSFYPKIISASVSGASAVNSRIGS